MRKQRFPPLSERFWSRVEVTDTCWLWTGPVRSGYGEIKEGSYIWGTHRLSWQWAYGPIPAGLFVLHHCDNRRCIRPSHLFIGTQGDNIRDAVSKSRMASGPRNGKRTHPEKRERGDAHWSRRMPERIARGERVGNSKLQPKDVLEIRRLRLEGATLPALAAAYNVRIGTIHFIVTGQTWKHLL